MKIELTAGCAWSFLMIVVWFMIAVLISLLAGCAPIGTGHPANGFVGLKPLNPPIKTADLVPKMPVAHVLMAQAAGIASRPSRLVQGPFTGTTELVMDCPQPPAIQGVYFLQSSDSLTPADWRMVSTNLSLASETTITNPMTSPMRFYRTGFVLTK